MAEIFKLPGSSYEELIKIIKAYSAVKNGFAATLKDLGQTTGMSTTVISRNNGFLVQIKLISEGNKKAPSDLCIKLGRAYQLNMMDQVVSVWNEIVKNDDFLSNMVSTIQIKGEMQKNDFVNHIVFSSSNSNTNNNRAGASAIIEILKIAQLIQEKEGKLVAGTVILDIYETLDAHDGIKESLTEKAIETTKTNDKEFNLSEKGYYIQPYTCESGKVAKFIIPEDATEDDLYAFYDMLHIVLKRKFKIKIGQEGES